MVTRSLFLISIAATSFGFLSLLINVLKIESVESISMCFYLQLISLLSMSSFKVDHIDLRSIKRMRLWLNTRDLSLFTSCFHLAVSSVN